MLFLSLVALLLFSIVTPLSIHSLGVEVCLWIVLIVAGILLLGRTWLRWQRRATIVALVMLLPVFVLFKWVLLWRGGDWMTQEIIFEHRTLPGRTLEFQMMNPGPGSYRKRTVDRQRLLPGLEWRYEVEPERVDTTNWKRVNREVNELGIKYA
jgi:hypothetical protein